MQATVQLEAALSVLVLGLATAQQAWQLCRISL
jgi:hypothetical protein